MPQILWCLQARGLVDQLLDRPIWISKDGVRGSVEAPTDMPAAQVVPVGTADGAIAALLVPDSLAYGLSRNGCPLPSGVLPLRHGDELQVSLARYWVSQQASVELLEYDPARHGEDQFCFITKVRLSAGEQIAVCPGMPGKDCNVVFKRDAWELALKRSKPRCPSCGFDPGVAGWRPSVRESSSLMPRLLQLLEPAS